MIKELNYYLTTNRFSQIAEDIDNSVREYAASFGNKHTGDELLREKTRNLCEDQLVLCGLRTNEDSFINIDTEFFEGGELVEANLNRFIKDILKAHGYQKILWEYMGTTGLMTEVSKSSMENDGFSYEKYLPVSLKEKEMSKKLNKITRNFNKLKDESGFNWNQSYDPNYTVTKKDWSGAFDENNVWNYYKVSELSNVTKKNKNEVYSIKIIKTENGCMLYDSGEILLNPIILWYLTHEDEVYGGEESNTKKIVEEIREQMKIIGVEKITEVAISGMSTQNSKTKLAEYKKILGTLADNKIQIVTKDYAEKQIINNQQKEKSAIIQKQSVELQNKIEVIKSANPEITTENLISALESGKTEIALDIIDYNDAVKASFTDEEYHEIKELIKSVKQAKKQEFIKACTIISSSWENYKTCGKSKIECINLIYNYLDKKEGSTFTYEKYLKDILLSAENNTSVANKNTFAEPVEIISLIENTLPQENKEFAKEYISSLPEQKIEVRSKVFNALQNAIKNYIVIRSSTGMSIKELFNYAIKSAGGTLPKSEITPPTIGYITPGMQTKVDDGNKRIFFESSVEELISELVNTALPTKEVSVAELENEYEELKIEKPVVVIGNTNESNDEQMVYNSSLEKEINPLVLAILKTMMIKSLVKKDIAKVKTSDEIKTKIISIAKKCDTQEAFIATLKKEYNIEYNFSEEVARKIFTKTNTQVNEELLTEYANDFEETAQKQIVSKDFIMGSISNIKPIFTQVDITEDKINAKEVVLPTGFKLMESKPVTSRGLEEVSVIQTRHTPVYSSNDGVVEQKIGEVELVENTNSKGIISSLIETTLTKTQKEELLHICNDDWNIITPLLVKEFIWRKKNKKSTKNLLQDIEQIQKEPQKEQIFELIEHQKELYKDNTICATSLETADNLTAEEKNEISTLLKEVTETDKMEMLKAANNNWNIVTPLFVKEYFWRKNNGKNVKTIIQDIFAYESIDTIPEDELIKYINSQNIVVKEDNVITFVENTFNKTQKDELLLVCNNDWDVITPLLIKEFMWRKKKRRSVKNIVQEIKSYEKLNIIPQIENTLTAEQKTELLQICKNDEKLISPLIIKEYLWCKKNKKSVENLLQEVKEKEILFNDNKELDGNSIEKIYDNSNTVDTIKNRNNREIVKLTTVEKQHFKMDYGLPTEGLSPVIKEYIQSGEWKNKGIEKFGRITTNENGIFTSVNGYRENISGITKGAGGISTGENKTFTDNFNNYKNSGNIFANSINKNIPSAIKVSNNKTKHINVDEPYSMSSELKETIREVSRTRRNVSKKTETKDYIDSPINAVTNTMSPEEIRMARINANYEHDKAVLAKTDPAFAAKNQFWDVGHAEDEEKNTVKFDESEVKKNTKWFEEELNKKLNKEIGF